jgi:uncharacterized protein (TIGR00661 family)
MAVSDDLRRRGHELLFCCGGTAYDILEHRGEATVHVPALRQVMECNEVKHARTIQKNWRTLVRYPEIIDRLTGAFRDFGADLIITDFEAFAPRAARRLDLPVLSFNHQQVVTETEYQLPSRYWMTAAITRATIQLIAPRDPVHVLLSSFFFPPLKHPERTTLVPPIIRPAVQALTPERGDHVLVYYNQSDGAEYVIDILRNVDAECILYNFDDPPQDGTYANLRFKEPCLEGFLDDLATSRAVICTAGFTLISEALYLGKPLLVVPNRGIFEQTLNALFLEREGFGAAVIDRPLTEDDVTSFLDHLDAYARRLRGHATVGNADALACIERLLVDIGVASPSTLASTPAPSSPLADPLASPK